MNRRGFVSGATLELFTIATNATGLRTGRSSTADRPGIEHIDPAVLDKLDTVSKSFVATAKAVEPAAAHLIVTRLVR